MAQGGPYSEQARTGFDPALAQAAATDPAMAVVGAPAGTDTTTRKTPRVQPASNLMEQQFNVGIDTPAYGWSLDQNDLGQGQVQQIRTDNFVTPVAEQKLPFGAIAARQQATSIRRQKLEDAKAQAIKDFDPYKGISDPAAQHQAAFSKYTTNVWWPEVVSGAMDAMGFPDRASAIQWMREDPEGQIYLKGRARQVDAAAKESLGMSKRVIDTLADVQSGAVTLPPDQLKSLVDYSTNYGETGVPNQGKSESEFLWDGRKMQPALSFAKFQKDFLSDFEKFAEQEVTRGSIKPLRGGRYEVTDEFKQKFDDYKKAKLQDAIDTGVLQGDEAAISKQLDLLIKPKVELKTRDWGTPSGGSGSGGGNTGVGTNVRADFRPLDTHVNGKVVAGQNTLFFTPFQTTGDKEHTVKQMELSGGVGAPDIPMRDATLVYRPGKKDWSIVGQSLSETGKRELKKTSERDDLSDDQSSEETERIWETYSIPKVVPADANSSVLKTFWGSSDANTAAARIAGIKPEEMARLVSTDAGRKQVAQKMGLPVPRKDGGSLDTDSDSNDPYSF